MSLTVKKSKKVLFSLLLAMLLVPLFNINVSAQTKIPQPSNNVSRVESSKTTEQEMISGDVQLPNVSFNEAKDLVERKTFDVVKLLQTFGKPFVLIVFLGCTCISLLGLLSKSGNLVKGLIGMFLSGVLYTAIIYAPEIVHFFSTWLST